MSTPSATDPRRRRLLLLGGILAAAAIVVVVLVLVSSSGGDDTTTPRATDSSGVAGAKQSTALFKGIQQKGAALGNPKAPVTLVEFADMQCPFCQEYALKALPGLVRKYVRTGKVRMEFRPVVFLGQDSLDGARVVAAAGNQNKLWNAVDVMYSNQGKENSGWLTDSLQGKILAAIPGLDAQKAMADRAANSVRLQLVRADNLSKKYKIEATPSFLVGKTGGKLAALEPNDLTTAAFAQQIDPLLSQ
jgi:protein-disulfide isomerase